MKKNKLFYVVMVSLLVISLLSGCSSKNTNTSAGTPAEEIVKSFNESVKSKSSSLDIAKEVNESIIKITGYNTDAMELTTTDYIEGFDTEIKGFEEAVVIKPMIGSQPFIAYVFKVSNPSEFEKELQENANLRWNICTSADEYKSSISGNYVFFVMSEKSFSE